MGINMMEFPEIATVTQTSDNDVIHVTHFESNGTKVDKRITFGVLAGFINGSVEVQEADGNDTININTSAGRKAIKVANFEKRLFGIEVFTSLSEDASIRVVAGTKRGTISAADFIKSTIPDDVNVDESIDLSKTFVRLNVNGKLSKVDYLVFDGMITGKNSDNSDISNDDRFLFFKADGTSRSRVKLSKIRDKFVPSSRLAVELIVDDMLLLSEAADKSRGAISLGELQTFIAAKLGLPKFDNADAITENISFMYKDGDKYGYLSRSGIRGVILSSDAITLDDATVFRAKTENADGVITFEAIKDKIMEEVNSIYAVDGASTDSSDINDGDGIIFLENGGSGTQKQFKNVSYLTLKNKILNDNNPIDSIGPDTKIFVEGGVITYQQLRDRLHSDFF